MNRRDFLTRLIAAAPALVLLDDVDIERALWTPKPMVTVPATPHFIGVDFGYGESSAVVVNHRWAIDSAKLAQQYRNGLMSRQMDWYWPGPANVKTASALMVTPPFSLDSPSLDAAIKALADRIDREAIALYYYKDMPQLSVEGMF